MAIYQVPCSKGGVGKTTTATNLAVHLALAGRRVCLIDSDEQQHASEWAQKRAVVEPALPRIECKVYILGKKTGAAVLTEVPYYDDLVVDTQGGKNRSAEMRSVLGIADYALMPFEAAGIVLKEVETMESELSTAHAYKPTLKALGFINKASNHYRRQEHILEAIAYLAQSEEMSAAQTALHLRDPFIFAWEQGRGVYELGKGAEDACSEFKALVAELAAL